MSDVSIGYLPADHSRRRFQYGLRTILVAMTFSSGLLYLLTLAPTWLAVPALLLFSILSTMFFVAGAIYAGDQLKAFCRGALLPTLACNLFVTWIAIQVVNLDLSDWSNLLEDEIAFILRRITVTYLFLSGLMGLSLLAFKWLVEPKSRGNRA